ncbi:ribokinase [Paenibacillus xerothermodurans]|uniref:Ribokinase n=1 Tax=Paenibacillus xerothermodurans TaxID=1977292 RepID=A0A2W1NGJ7_PAEXE|nr:ribokinase [Paenibacillus xerothermodurans]PZE22810.1 ribokinase [Paenibacillus xerothermodurans]
MKMKANIVVVGSINQDIVVRSPKLPVKGETVLGEDYFMVPGGKGANQAVAASRLGTNVAMIGCLGKDVFGEQMLQHLKAEGIDTSHITMLADHATGIALIPVTSSGDNFIVVSPGANMQLKASHIEQGEDVIKNAHAMLVQLEIPLDAVRAALAIAKKHDVLTILNPAPAVQLSDDIYALTDIITPNETEGNQLVAGDAEKGLDADEIITKLIAMGVGNVLLTRGGDGTAFREPQGIREFPAYKVDVVDTTAAGDACNAALAVALAEERSFGEAVAFATKAAALTVTKRGAQSSLPSRDEVDRFVGS